MYFQNAIADKLKVTRPTKEESGEDYKKADNNPQDGKIDQAEFKNMLNDLAKSAEAKHLNKQLTKPYIEGKNGE